MVIGVLLLLIFSFGGWYLFTSIFDAVLSMSKKNDNYTYKPDNITNINHVTENHLHISKEYLENLLNNKN